MVLVVPLALAIGGIAYVAGYVASRRLGNLGRFSVLLGTPLICMLVVGVLSTAFPVESSCELCVTGFLYPAIIVGGILGSWVGILVGWAVGRAQGADPSG